MQTIVCFDQASITIDTIVQVGTTIGDVIIMKDTFFTNTYDDSNNACDSLVHYIVNIASGITKLPENNYHLYPNPANNVLTVTSKEVLIESIQIFDTQGLNLMMLKDIHSNSVEVSISLLPAGLYILAINNTNSIGIRQIIKL